MKFQSVFQGAQTTRVDTSVKQHLLFCVAGPTGQWRRRSVTREDQKRAQREATLKLVFERRFMNG